MSAPIRSRQMQTLTLVPLRERLCRFFGSQIYEFGIIALIGINAVVLAAETIPYFSEHFGGSLEDLKALRKLAAAKLAGVDRETIARHGAVSKEVALGLLAACQEHVGEQGFDDDFTIAVVKIRDDRTDGD